MSKERSGKLPHDLRKLPSHFPQEPAAIQVEPRQEVIIPVVQNNTEIAASNLSAFYPQLELATRILRFEKMTREVRTGKMSQEVFDKYVGSRLGEGLSEPLPELDNESPLTVLRGTNTTNTQVIPWSLIQSVITYNFPMQLNSEQIESLQDLIQKQARIIDAVEIISRPNGKDKKPVGQFLIAGETVNFAKSKPLFRLASRLFYLLPTGLKKDSISKTAAKYGKDASSSTLVINLNDIFCREFSNFLPVGSRGILLVTKIEGTEEPQFGFNIQAFMDLLDKIETETPEHRASIKAASTRL